MVYPIQYWVDPYVYGAYRFMAPKAVMFFLPPALFHGFCLFMPVPRSIVKCWPWTPHAILGWIFSPRLVEVAKICCILEIWPFQVLHINFQYLLPLGWRDPPDMGTKRLLQHLFLWIFSGFGRGLGWTWVDYSHGSAIARRRQVPMPAMQNTPWPRAWTRHGMAMGCHGMFWRWLDMAEKWSKSPLLVDNLVGYLLWGNSTRPLPSTSGMMRLAHVTPSTSTKAANRGTPSCQACMRSQWRRPYRKPTAHSSPGKRSWHTWTILTSSAPLSARGSSTNIWNRHSGATPTSRYTKAKPACGTLVVPPPLPGHPHPLTRRRSGLAVTTPRLQNKASQC